VQTKLFIILLLSFAAAALPEDFHTIDGKEYKDATVTRMEPDGIVVKTNSGVTKIYFTELPKDVQERFRYDSKTAASYSAEQAANYIAYQKQQEEMQRQQHAADAKTTAALAAQQAVVSRTQDLQTRYAALQKQEDDLLVQIAEAKKPGPSHRQGKTVHHQPNPQKSQLTVLQNHLKDVRREKSEVRKELEKAQH